MTHTQEGGCCEKCMNWDGKACFDASCPCHTPQTKETESVDAIAQRIQDLYHQNGAYASTATLNATVSILNSLQAQNQAKIDEAVEKEMLLVLRGIQHKWMSDGEVKTLEDIDARIKALTPKDI